LFRAWLAFLDESQHWPAARQAVYQLAQLRRLLAHGEAHVPYWRRLFAERGIRSADCAALSFLTRIPPLTKDLVRANLDALRADPVSLSGPATKFTTGGSTGEPMALYRDDASWEIERAFIARAWRWAGWRVGEPMLQIRGNVVDERRLASGRIWRIDRRENVMRVSPYHLGREALPKLLEAVRRFKPRFLHAYPTSALLLAQLLDEAQAELGATLTAVLLGSEPVYPHQRALLERVFRCRVFSHYGLAEGAALATECATSAEYHLMPEYAVVEFLRPGSDEPAQDGEIGEIVGTCLFNYAFPLLRYRTDDYVRVRRARSAGCGHDFPALGFVLGRGQDVIVRRDGGLIPLTSFSFGRHMAAYERMRAMQFEQREAGRLVFRVVRGPGFGEQDAAELLAEFHRNGHGQVEIALEYVDAIDKTASGKQRHLIQRLPIAGPYCAAPSWGADD